jgi:hypothetical protein
VRKRLLAIAAIVGLSLTSVGLLSTAAVGGSDCSIKGTSGTEMLTGTEDADVICARAGSDFVDALAGDDIVRGGGGNDTVVGGEGDDSLFGGKGNDRSRPRTVSPATTPSPEGRASTSVSSTRVTRPPDVSRSWWSLRGAELSGDRHQDQEVESPGGTRSAERPQGLGGVLIPRALTKPGRLGAAHRRPVAERLPWNRRPPVESRLPAAHRRPA